MKKLIMLVVACIVTFSFLKAQTFIAFEDDFDRYTAGNWLGQSSSTWTSWGGVPGPGGDDIKITNTDAASGNNSIYFTPGPGPEDVVLPFGGEHNTGMFLFKAKFKVPTGKTAYFNFQEFSTIGTSWAMDVNIETTGDITFENSSTVLLSSTIPNDRWFELKIIVNLSANIWNAYIDDNYLGSFSNPVNQVASVDIYPTDADASFWVDDVAFYYASPAPDNAGILELSEPALSGLTCGNYPVKAVVANNGNNKLDSVRVYWSLDGVTQPPIFVTTPIDTAGSTSGNDFEVTLSNSVAFGTTPRNIRVWTAFPNGNEDTLNFDDELQLNRMAIISGVGSTQEVPFNGRAGAGTAASPDTVCVGDTLTYGITPPTGYTNADLGTDWFITDLVIERSFGTPPVDTMTLLPNATANARLQYVADPSEAGHVFMMATTVQVGTAGCETIITRYFYVAPVPTPDFTANDVCFGEIVNFTNNSSGSGKLAYNWDFGNSTSSTAENPIRVYASPGTYQVTLEVTNTLACMASVMKSVHVNQAPAADFTAVNNCDGGPVMFTDASSISTGSISSHSWDFGGGLMSSKQDPSFTFDSAGTYDVTLTVISDQGCEDQVMKQVEVYEIPDADFTVTNACVSDAVAFADVSSYNGTGLTYSWDFGDGNTSTMQNPTHAYGASGIYFANMVVTSPNGCMDSLMKIVEVYPEPVADFSFSGQCFGEMTAFMNSSNGNGGVISSYSWDFGDGNISAAMNPTHQYNAAGQYQIKLIVMNGTGCSDTMNKMVDIHEVPMADFITTSGCLGDPTMFTNQSTIGSGSMTYNWTFGNGRSSTDMDPTNTYVTYGMYDVRLITMSDMGCSDTMSHSVEIFPLPVADFSANTVCAGDATTFTNESASMSDTMEFVWDFGDGMTSTDMSPDHVYASDGSYDVMLKVMTENGCMDSMMMTVQVNATPDATFTHAHFGNGLYEFTPNVLGLTSYSWDFGDGSTSNDANGRHQYDDFGTFNVMLTVRNSNGCESTSDVDLEYATGIEDKPEAASFINVYPNPYKESTHIVYQLEKASQVTVEVYSMEGKLVERLANEQQQAGEHRYNFSGRESGSGSFIVRFTIDGETYMKQIVKLK